MAKYYSISELSNEMNIPVSTLRFYQRNKLFLPAVKDKNNNYCYYSSEQMATLEMITFLRELDMPVKIIQSIVSQGLDHTGIVQILHEHKMELETQINELRYRLEKVSQTEERFLAAAEDNWNPALNTVTVKDCNERWFIAVPTEDFGLDDGSAWHLRIRKTMYPVVEDYDYPKVIYSMGGIAPWTNYRDAETVHYSAAYIEPVSQPQLSVDEKRCFITKHSAGKYLVVRFLNNTENRLQAYRLLWDYVAENHCKTEPFVYDGIIDCVLPPTIDMERTYELHLKLIE